MHMVDNIKTFLYDKQYFINIFNNCIHVFNYIDLVKLSEKEIILQLENFKLVIVGQSLRVSKMIEKEIQIVGTIDNVGFNR